jgi:methylase of polypeptide subunit release factors
MILWRNIVSIEKIIMSEFIYPSGSVSIEDNSVCPVTPYSIFFLENFPLVAQAKVLDYGFGSGVLSIFAALSGATQVVGIETNKLCLDIAQDNARFNQVANIDFRIKSDNHTFEDIDLPNGFDMVICNPASLPSNRPLPSFLDSGLYGLDMISELIKTSAKVLRNGGELFFILTSLTPKIHVEKYLEEEGFRFQSVGNKKIPFRDFYVPLIPYFEELSSSGLISFEVSNGKHYETLELYRACK